MGSFALGGAIAAVLCVPPAVSVAAGASPDVVLTLRRPVLASSTASVAWAPSGITDAHRDTRWASASDPGTQWVRVDLGTAQEVRRVRLAWAGAHARAYRIQISDDGATWTDLYRTSSGNGGTDDVRNLRGAGRYLRILATQRDGTGGYSLWDVRAYGPGPAAPVTEATASSTAVPPQAADLTSAAKKELAFKLVSSAENSTLDWRGQYGYIEDLGDGRGYTGGIVGFCSGTSDMLAVVTEYTRRKPENGLARYLPALRAVDGTDSHRGLDPGFPQAWRAAAGDAVFRKAQEDVRDRLYFRPAVRLAEADGLRALGQYIYYDAAVMHGVTGLREIRERAVAGRRTPAQGGDEIAYLHAFLDARRAEMRTEAAHSDTTRVDTAQRVFLRAGNLDLATPLRWRVYGDRYTVTR